MSVNINHASTGRAKRILMIAANASTSTVTGWPVGFWWSELTHPYWVFTEAGYEVEIRSPDGGRLLADGHQCSRLRTTPRCTNSWRRFMRRAK
jgi:putative intracellular protease/amidase